jgi:hypothetical protein
LELRSALAFVWWFMRSRQRGSQTFSTDFCRPVCVTTRRLKEPIMSEDQQPEIQPERLPFDVELFKRADEFCTAILTSVPELHGVAIIPLWNTQPENIPSGLLRLRNPQPPYAGSLLSLLKRLASFNFEVHRDLINQLQMYDNYAAELARQIKARQEELTQSPTAQPDNHNG